MSLLSEFQGRYRFPCTRFIILLLLLLVAYLSYHPSQRYLILLGVVASGGILLVFPVLSPFVLIIAAVLTPFELGTGTQVALNPAVLVVPVLLMVLIVDRIRFHGLRFSPSRVNQPLVLFLVASSISLVAGNALWDTAVPRPSNFLLVQLGQLGLFFFSAAAFWLGAGWLRSPHWLRRLVFFFLTLGGILAMMQVVPGLRSLVGRFTTIAVIRAPFWILLVALAGGQWLFNPKLSLKKRVILVGIMLIAFYYGLIVNRVSISTWAPMLVVLGVLLWLRFPQLRRLLLIAAMLGSILFFPALYEFAGGEEEWTRTGGSRLALIGRVVEVAMHNPILGLGPASYRHYAAMEPLRYQRALWWQPNVSSHNNYVDIFAHTGMVGLGLFLWFLFELGRLGWRMSQKYREGFLAGYLNGMLAALVALLFAMLLADWFLPFVYNIGFPGFQASVLAWLFLGGMVAIDQRPVKESLE